MRIYLTSALQLIWRNRMLRWTAVLFFVVVNGYAGLMSFIYHDDFMAAVSMTQWVSLLTLIFSLFWGYELFRAVSAANLTEVFRGIPGAPARVYGSQMLLAGTYVAAVTVSVLAWNAVAYLLCGVEAPAALLNAGKAAVLHILLVGLVALGIGFLFAGRLKRLTAYSLSVLLVFFNSPILSSLRGLLTGLPDTVESVLNRCLDLFVLTPQNLEMYPNIAYGIPVETYRWQLVCAWLLLLTAALVLTIHTRRRAVARTAGVCLTCGCVLLGAMSFVHGCAYLTDKRSDGVVGFDQFYAPYNQTIMEGFTYDFIAPGFTVSRYTMKLQIAKELRAQVTMELDGAAPEGAYTFTLHHGMRLHHVTGADGEPLAYERDGDFFTVKSGGAQLKEITVAYHGGNPNLYANSQGVNLPGSYSYYPMPGNRLLMTRNGGAYLSDYIINGDDTQFRLEVDGGSGLFCNLPQTARGVYEGKAKTVTLMAGILDNDTVDGVTLVRPSLRVSGEGIKPDTQFGELGRYLERCNVLLGTRLASSLKGKTVFTVAGGISTDVQTAVFSDHVILNSQNDVARIAAEIATAGISPQNMEALRSSLIHSLKSGLAYLIDAPDGDFYQVQQGYQPELDDFQAAPYLDMAGEHYTDAEILKQVYDYLVQPNPQQSTREFLSALAGV